VEHAIGAEKRTPAKLEGDSVAAPLADPAGVKHWMVRRGGAGFACYIFLKVLEIHDLRSWLLFPVLPLERLWRGLKRRNPPPGSLLAVGWKLFLAC